MSNVVDLIWAQAKARPQAIAIRQGKQQLTYADLIDSVDRCVDYMNNTTRLSRQAIVAIMTCRGPAEIIGLLAVLKAGGIALPLDKEWPNERNSQIITHSHAALLLCDTHTRGHLSLPERCDTLNIDNLLRRNTLEPFTAPANKAKSEKSALLTYTNVEIDQSKAIGLKHSQLNLLIHALRSKPGFHAAHCMGLLSSPASQWSIIEILLPLSVGGSIEIVTQARATRLAQLLPDVLLPRINQSRITHLQLSTDLLAHCIQTAHGWPEMLPPHIWVGGERISQAVIDAIPPHNDTLWYFFGLPETGGWITIEQLNKIAGKRGKSPISPSQWPLGHPLNTVSLLVLDDNGEPVKRNQQEGTLWVTGPALTEGYHREPDLNRSLLCVHPKHPDIKIFNTGLRVVREANRALTLRALSNFTINRFEFSLEPTDIENKLRRHPLVDDAFVQIDTTHTLCEFHATLQVSKHLLSGENSDTMFLETLRESLPPYFLPDQIRLVQEIPSGKNALPRYFNAQSPRSELMPTLEDTQNTKKIGDPIPEETLADSSPLLDEALNSDPASSSQRPAVSQNSTVQHQTSTDAAFSEVQPRVLASAEPRTESEEKRQTAQQTKKSVQQERPNEPPKKGTTATSAPVSTPTLHTVQKPTDPHYSAPANAQEAHIAQCFANLIGYEKVGIVSDLYQFADSVTLGRFCLKLREYYHWKGDGQSIPFLPILKSKNLRQISDLVVRKPEGVNLPPILVAPRNGSFTMTTQQRQAWYIESLTPSSPLNNISFQIELRGPLSVERLEAAINAIIKQQEILRCEVHKDQSLPVMRPVDQASIRLRTVNLQPNTGESTASALRAKGLFLQRQPILLTKAPLIRCLLMKVQPTPAMGESEDTQTHYLHITAHRLIWDEHSSILFTHSLKKAYQQTDENDATILPELPFQHHDYITWQERRYRTRTQLDMAYWRRQLDPTLPTPALLKTTPNTAQAIPPFGEREPLTFVLKADLTQALQKLAQRTRTSVPTIMLSAYALLIARYTNQTQVMIGCQTPNRLTADAEHLLGPFGNLVPLRLCVDPAQTFQEFIDTLVTLGTEAYGHQSIPFDDLVQAFSQKRRKHEPALIAASFRAYRHEDIPRTLGPCALKMAPPIATPGGRAVHLEVGYDRKNIEGTLFTRTAYLNAQSVSKLTEHYEHLLTLMTKAPGQQLRHFNALTAKDLNRILSEYNNRQYRFTFSNSITQWVGAQASKLDKKAAIFARGQQINYASLEQQSNQMAHALIRLGLKPGQFCAVCLERTVHLPVTLLAIWKCGATVMPLDPDMPTAFNRSIIVHAEPTFLIADTLFLTHAKSLVSETGKTELIIREKIALKVEPNTTPLIKKGSTDIAYLFYLFQGRQALNAICVPHAAIINLLQSMLLSLGITPEDRCLALSPLTFDDHIFEMWLPLCSGGTSIIKEPDCSILELLGTIDSEKITALQAKPEVWSRIESAKWKGAPYLRGFVAGGQISKSLVDFLVARLHSLWCFYGTTESTVWNTVQKHASTLPETLIGKPLHNIKAFVLDETGHPTPEGCTGELYIGGACLTKGYFKDPAKTQERFHALKLPDGSTRTLLRTGDKAAWHPSGVLEYRGSSDQFLKIGGHRVELSEIEQLLEAMPKVQRAAVTATSAPHYTTRLTAYVEPVAGSVVTPNEVKAFLRDRLPQHAQPTKVCYVIKLPETADGKIDRNALPAPEAIIKGRVPPSPKPQTKLEKRIALMWHQLLKVENISLSDNFFDLGGHSLLALSFIQAIEESCQHHLSLETLQDKTLAQIAAQIESNLPQNTRNAQSEKTSERAIFKRTRRE